MPQFDPSTFANQLFWLALTFIVLYWVLWKLVLPKVSEVLEARQRRIDDDLNRASALKQEAEGVLAEYEEAMAEGTAKAQAMIRDANDALAAEAAKHHAELAETLADDVKAAEARILEAKDAAVRNVAEIATGVAQAATERLIGVAPEDKTAAAAVDTAMKGQA